VSSVYRWSVAVRGAPGAGESFAVSARTDWLMAVCCASSGNQLPLNVYLFMASSSAPLSTSGGFEVQKFCYALLKRYPDSLYSTVTVQNTEFED
jgi:hypothetical protein